MPLNFVNMPPGTKLHVKHRVTVQQNTAGNIVWLELVGSPGDLGAGVRPNLVKLVVGAMPKGNGWIAIDEPATHTVGGTMGHYFGDKLGDKVIDLQKEIAKEWNTFDSNNPARWAKGLTIGKDLSSAAILLRVLKAAFQSIGLGGHTYEGLRLTSFTAKDVVDSLNLRARAVPQVADVAAVLPEFDELFPDLRYPTEDPPDTLDQRTIRLIQGTKTEENYKALLRQANEEAKKSLVKAGKMKPEDPAPSGFLYSKHFIAMTNLPRVITYAFRGDSRPPSAIKNVGGFLPNFTRPDHIIQALAAAGDVNAVAKWNQKSPGQAPQAAPNTSPLDVVTYLKDQFLGGYVSGTKSYAIAKAFGSGMGGTTGAPRNAGWVYVCFMGGGFEVPNTTKTMQMTVSDERPGASSTTSVSGNPVYAEQEIALPGMIDWEDMVAFRRVDATGMFTGDVFIRPSLQQKDPAVHKEIWELLSGKPQ